MGEGINVFLRSFIGGFEIARDGLEGLAEFGIHGDRREDPSGSGREGPRGVQIDRSKALADFGLGDEIEAASIIVLRQKGSPCGCRGGLDLPQRIHVQITT